VRSRQGESGDAVIERGRSPSGCRMAFGAVCRSKCGAGTRVDGSGRLLPGCQMALRISAIGRGDRQSIVVIDVAECASHIRMAIGEQESSGAVVERRRRPTYRIVASRTIRRCKRRAGGKVHGIVGLLPGRQEALRIAAIRRLDGQVVIPVDMAQGALHVGVAIR
jgi:hypothetical protein